MPQTGTAAYPNPGGRYELSRLRALVAAHPEALHCVWFGKSQGNMAGLSHLDAAVVHLRHFARHRPVTLTVISNSRLKYLRSEEHTSELQSLMRISYAVFCLKKKNYHTSTII